MVIWVQELPASGLLGSGLLCHHWPVLALDFSGLALELTALEQPRS